MRRNFVIFGLIVLVSTVMVAGGCAKKIVPMESDAQEQKEEQAVSKPKEDMGKKESKIKETDIGSSRTMPKKDKPAGKTAGIETIYFDYDQYNIREDMREQLESNAKWLKSHPKLSVKIEGHADERGTAEYNLALGQRRAKAIRQFLLALGIESSRLSMISFGEEKPGCSAQTDRCFAKNRRAQFDLGR